MESDLRIINKLRSEKLVMELENDLNFQPEIGYEQVKLDQRASHR